MSEYSDSALHYAAARGGVATVTALLRAGAAVNLRNVYDATPLWNCAVHVETLRAMLEAGAATDVPSTGAGQGRAGQGRAGQGRAGHL